MQAIISDPADEEMLLLNLDLSTGVTQFHHGPDHFEGSLDLYDETEPNRTDSAPTDRNNNVPPAEVT